MRCWCAQCLPRKFWVIGKVFIFVVKYQVAEDDIFAEGLRPSVIASEERLSIQANTILTEKELWDCVFKYSRS